MFLTGRTVDLPREKASQILSLPDTYIILSIKKVSKLDLIEDNNYQRMIDKQREKIAGD